jgi:hypothetical protein
VAASEVERLTLENASQMGVEAELRSKLRRAKELLEKTMAGPGKKEEAGRERHQCFNFAFQFSVFSHSTRAPCHAPGSLLPFRHRQARAARAARARPLLLKYNSEDFQG